MRFRSRPAARDCHVVRAAFLRSSGTRRARTVFLGADATRSLLSNSATAAAQFQASVASFGTETFARAGAAPHPAPPPRARVG